MALRDRHIPDNHRDSHKKKINASAGEQSSSSSLQHANATRHPGQNTQGQTSRATYSSLNVLFRLVVFQLQHVDCFLKSFRLAAHPIYSGFTMSRAPKGHHPERYPASLNLDHDVCAVWDGEVLRSARVYHCRLRVDRKCHPTSGHGGWIDPGRVRSLTADISVRRVLCLRTCQICRSERAGWPEQTYPTAPARGEEPAACFGRELGNGLVLRTRGVVALHCAHIGAWWTAFGINGLSVVANGGGLRIELRDKCR